MPLWKGPELNWISLDKIVGKNGNQIFFYYKRKVVTFIGYFKYARNGY